jgi:uncharacterized protein
VLLARRKRERQRTGSAATASLYYASDVHGSERCWRKFLGAARFYGVEVLVMGGDLVGKAIVPIERRPDGTHAATFIGELRTCRDESELVELEDAIRFNGMYPWIASQEEIVRHEGDASAQAELFERVMVAELKRWLDLADQRMSSAGVSVYVMAGNDDPWACDEVIAAAAHVQACDERIVRVGPHEMLSLSWANPTPWKSPRELPEDELYNKLKGLAEQLEDPGSSIFNLHVPPYDTGLDTANEMNPDLTLVYRGGQPNPVPVGSTAVRQIIEEYQPVVALHGHIHESRGEVRLGKTLALNPGSEYNSGHIHGVVVRLESTSVLNHQFVVG